MAPIIKEGTDMQVKLTTLSENTANFGCIAEWGLSILVEADNLRILMDTGLSFSAVHNAQKLGVDLSNIDRIVLSHGHIDHTGGLSEVLSHTGGVEVIGHPGIWEEKYSQRTADTISEIGMPLPKDAFESIGARFTLSKEPVRISEHIMTSGEIPMITEYEQVETNLLVKKGGELVHDPVADDLSLFIDTDYGLVIITGCAHRGIINIIHRAQQLTGRQQVYAVVGGIHLHRASEVRIEQTIADLKETGIQKLGVSHCTGFYASCRLYQEFSDIFFLNNAGTSITFPA